MNSRIQVLLAGVLVVAGCAALAWALGADIPPDQPLGRHPDYPAGLYELLSSEGRVDGYFVNACDFLSYHGDTKAFNKFLAGAAKLKDTPLKLTLHPGRGMTSKPWKDHKPVPFEWQANVLRRGWHPDAPEAKAGEKGPYVVTLDLWLGGDVALDELDVPLGVEVQSGMEIERFIHIHEMKRGLVAQEAKKAPA